MLEEIISQPETWTKAAGHIDQVNELFEESGGPMCLVGCGTSYFVAGALAKMREARGLGISDPFQASEIPLERRYPWVLFITRSGTTSEIARALSSFKGRARTMLITANSSSPMLKVCNRSLVVDYCDERSVVQTRFATSVIMTMRKYLGEDVDLVVERARQITEEDISNIIDPKNRIVFLGHDWAFFVAQEAQLKMTECAGVQCVAYSSFEFRHGPMSSIGPGTVVWMIGPDQAGVVGEIRQTGAQVIGGDLDPVLELIKVQLSAEYLARLAGRDPDCPPYLTRSVILDS